MNTDNNLNNFRIIDFTPDDIVVTLKNLEQFKKNLDKQIDNTSIYVDNIVENANKKFISEILLNKLKNDVYTKKETEDKISQIVSSLTFKGTFQTINDLPRVGCEDGWLAIVINDPTLNGKNVLYIYETAKLLSEKTNIVTENGQWIKLGELTTTEIANETTNGLMSSEMVISLNKCKTDITEIKKNNNVMATTEQIIALFNK